MARGSPAQGELCREGPRGPDGKQVGPEPAVRPRGQEGQWHPWVD